MGLDVASCQRGSRIALPTPHIGDKLGDVDIHHRSERSTQSFSGVRVLTDKSAPVGVTQSDGKACFQT